MKRISIAFLALTFGIAIAARAFVPSGGIETESVSVPYYDDQTVYLSAVSLMTSSDPLLADFAARHGEWAAQINERTGGIRQLWGGAAYVGVPTDNESARVLALKFLRSESSTLGVSPDDLKIESVRRALDRRVVRFGQLYDGLEIYGSGVTVVISERGNVTLFRSDYFPAIRIDTFPSIDKQSSKISAMDGLVGDDYRITDPELVVFPLPTESGFDYRLAYRTEVSSDLPARWLVLVDARDGQVLYRKNLIHYETVDGYIEGQIYEATPFDPLTTMPFEFEVVDIDQAGQVYTDQDGFFTAEVANSDPLSFDTELRGYYVDVNNSGGLDATYSGIVTPGDTLHFEWDLSSARHDERNGYYHTNVVHDFIKALDPGFTDLDFPLPCNVNINQTCNAFWDGNSINFYRAGGGCENTGEIADVIYHEYGHGITDFLYRPSSPSGAQHEGWSDYTAATITNQPLIGRGFYGEGTYIRSVDNNMRYPEDWTGEPHNDGLIIAGALWDLREALDPRVSYCDTLFHFARYGLSQNFEDYLIDILEWDDDDDNLFNGTPNSELIYAAFDLHGIGPGDQLVIYHDGLDDTMDDQNPYEVVATIWHTITPVDEDLIFVNYRTNRDDEFAQVHMVPTGNPAEYSGSIPAQPLGTLVEYYISAVDEMGRQFFNPIGAPDRTHVFIVGEPNAGTFDDLETDTGWQVGAIDDDAITGIWERVDPNGTYADNDPNFPYQPEDDHTPEPGVNCYITGQQPLGEPDNGYNDVDEGKTTLFTPLYDLDGMENVLIEYYRWYTIRTSLDDSFFVDISNDGGNSWINLETVTSTENYWQRSRFLLEQFAEPTSEVLLRFVASDYPPGSLVEAGVDDLAIYSFVPTGIEPEGAEGLPTAFALHQNYPNPFNGRTEVSFDLPEQSDVLLTIYDISGRMVRDYRMESMPAGSHTVVWDGRNDSDQDVSSGIYLYRMRAGEYSCAKKMLFLK
jgi:Zn-dependent metalloprotease